MLHDKILYDQMFHNQNDTRENVLIWLASFLDFIWTLFTKNKESKR